MAMRSPLQIRKFCMTIFRYFVYILLSHGAGFAFGNSSPNRDAAQNDLHFRQACAQLLANFRPGANFRHLIGEHAIQSQKKGTVGAGDLSLGGVHRLSLEDFEKNPDIMDSIPNFTNFQSSGSNEPVAHSATSPIKAIQPWIEGLASGNRSSNNLKGLLNTTEAYFGSVELSDRVLVDPWFGERIGNSGSGESLSYILGLSLNHNEDRNLYMVVPVRLNSKSEVPENESSNRALSVAGAKSLLFSNAVALQVGFGTRFYGIQRIDKEFLGLIFELPTGASLPRDETTGKLLSSKAINLVHVYMRLATQGVDFRNLSLKTYLDSEGYLRLFPTDLNHISLNKRQNGRPGTTKKWPEENGEHLSDLGVRILETIEPWLPHLSEFKPLAMQNRKKRTPTEVRHSFFNDMFGVLEQRTSAMREAGAKINERLVEHVLEKISQIRPQEELSEIDLVRQELYLFLLERYSSKLRSFRIVGFESRHSIFSIYDWLPEEKDSLGLRMHRMGADFRAVVSREKAVPLGFSSSARETTIQGKIRKWHLKDLNNGRYEYIYTISISDVPVHGAFDVKSEKVIVLSLREFLSLSPIFY